HHRPPRAPSLAVASAELRDRVLLVPLQRRGARGDETIYGIAPWFLEVIGAALVFTGHETPSEAEAQEVRSSLREAGFDVDDLSEQEDEQRASRGRADPQPTHAS